MKAIKLRRERKNMAALCHGTDRDDEAETLEQRVTAIRALDRESSGCRDHPPRVS